MNRTGTFLAAIAALVLLSSTGMAGTSERIVTDRYTGLAISGFDPVAYFADQAPREGLIAFELNAGGAIWRFRNPGNRESFAAYPDLYTPQFGGYDPVDVTRGVARAGRPQIWAVIDRRLYLFADETNRDQFARDDAALRRAASDRWPEVQALLAQ